MFCGWLPLPNHSQKGSLMLINRAGLAPLAAVCHFSWSNIAFKPQGSFKNYVDKMKWVGGL
jgi:hypothetical protein